VLDAHGVQGPGLPRRRSPSALLHLASALSFASFCPTLTAWKFMPNTVGTPPAENRRACGRGPADTIEKAAEGGLNISGNNEVFRSAHLELHLDARRRTQGLQHNARFLGSRLEFGDKTGIRPGLGTEPHVAAHRLEPDGHGSIDHHGATDVHVPCHGYFERFKVYTEQIGNHANRRILARGKRGTQDVPRRGCVVEAAERAVHADRQGRAATGHRSTTEWFGSLAF